MPLGAGDQMLFEVEVEKHARTEQGVDLDDCIAEGLLIDVQSQRQREHVSELEQEIVQDLNYFQKHSGALFYHHIQFPSRLQLLCYGLGVLFIIL